MPDYNNGRKVVTMEKSVVVGQKAALVRSALGLLPYTV